MVSMEQAILYVIGSHNILTRRIDEWEENFAAQLERLGDRIMAGVTELNAAIADLKTASTEILADLDAEIAKLAAGSPDLAPSIANLTAISEALKAAHAAIPAPAPAPAPTPTPPPAA